MACAKSIIPFGYPPTRHVKPSIISTSLDFPSIASIKHLSLLRGKCNIRRLQTNHKSKRSFVVFHVVQPGAAAPPPSGPPFNFLNWILGVVLTIVLPLTSHKWNPLLKLKNEVDTAVETIEVIVDAVEKVAEGVEKAAEHLAEDLPEGGGLRKAVDFVEHVAENVSKDAHLVGDFIDKVQEAEEKAEACVESLAEEVILHKHPKEEDETNNEDQKNY